MVCFEFNQRSCRDQNIEQHVTARINIFKYGQCVLRKIGVNNTGRLVLTRLCFVGFIPREKRMYFTT